MVAGCGAEICPVNGSGVKPSVRRAQGGASVIHSPIAASDFAPVRRGGGHRADQCGEGVDPAFTAPGIGYPGQECSQVNGIEEWCRGGYRGQLAQRGGGRR
ncbi:hypothetical protein GCM10009716_17100 [Streptomyces sodiiphilus]|uniref:Uncharacterized protein n=1 Tax=Streptomyces sodiiphilus TaxID=226217 RepID=A0ABN2NZC2_9ACTN